MTDTETDEIRQLAQSNDQPAIADDQGGQPDVEDGDSGLPTPSLSRKHLLVIGAVVAVAVAIWWLKSRDTDGGASAGKTGESVADVKSTDMTPESAEINGDDEEDETIEVPQQPDNPLERDEAVAEQLKDRGKLGGGEGS